MSTKSYHIPVMLQESIAGLEIIPSGTYVDVTFGGGGYTQGILQRLVNGQLFSFDKDQDVVHIANKVVDPAFTFIKAPFRFMQHFLNFYGVYEVDGIVADLGVSSHQFDTKERGFSTRFDTALDMRMDTKNLLTAAKIINTYPVNEITNLLQYHGEVYHASAIARAIVSARDLCPIETTTILKKIIQPFAPKNKKNQYYAKVFQAFRITVNNELEELQEMLIQSEKMIKKGGRLVVVSYHSLEDRLVKNFINKGNITGYENKDIYGNTIKSFIPINKKLTTPSLQEIQNNSRSRSAKLRIGMRV